MSTDINYKSYVGQDNLQVKDEVFAPVFPLDFSDVLKFSNCTNVVVDNCTVQGGKEDCIDIVRGRNYTITNNTELTPNGVNGITIKGSIDGYIIDNIQFTKHGKDSDICIGQFDNYWYPGRAPTRNGFINNVTTTDGSKIIIKVWDGDKPFVTNSNVKVVKVPKIIWFPYFLFRYIQIRLS